MSNNNINIKDAAQPLIEPAPAVRVTISAGGKLEQVWMNLHEGADVDVGGFRARLTYDKVAPKLAISPSENGKTMFRIESDTGRVTHEYVRGQVRALERFAEEYPDEKVVKISVI